MITIIVHRSAGNGEVGSMWHESFQFDEMTTLGEIVAKCRNKDIQEDIIIPVQPLKPER